MLKIVKTEIEFSYDKLQFMGDHIKLSVNVDYKLIGERWDALIPIKNRFSYKIVNGNGITAEELFVILENCIERINIFIKELNPPLKSVPDLLPEPLWEDNSKRLRRKRAPKYIK